MKTKWITIPEGELKYLTVDTKALRENQAFHSRKHGTGPRPPCWVQIGDDKQHKINCWNIVWDGHSAMRYGHPRICGAMVYLETRAALTYEVDDE